MQPDDFPFLDEWTPPPNTPGTPDSGSADKFPAYAGLPNIDSLRTNGAQMMQAYSAAPTCGTSRFSTLTGRMPSRSVSAKTRSELAGWNPVWATIPTTKLEETDCSNDNMAVAFQSAGYRTGMFGKWHLTKIKEEVYTYERATDYVKRCGFTDVSAVYVENMANGEDKEFNSFSDGTFSHNMEWVTHEAIKFINETSQSALTEFSCWATADKEFFYPNFVDPWIKGMSEDAGCVAYRQTVLDRALTDEDLGKIWLDDAVGALLTALKDNGQFDNTVFLFQEDHGMDTKGSLYEGGIRIPQFVHYPNGIGPGTVFDGLVSTVDIAPTMMDFANIEPPSYPIDGESWKDALIDPGEMPYWRNRRCIFFEIEQDRAIRCGCFKLISIFDTDYSTTYREGELFGLINKEGDNFFGLCDGSGKYIDSSTNNQEVETFNNPDVKALFQATLSCHKEHTNPFKPSDFTTCLSPFTKPPTPSPTTSCVDSTVVVPKLKTCQKVKNTGKCKFMRHWTHCRSTCNKCLECEDSLQQLKLPYKVNRVYKKKGKEKEKKANRIKCNLVKKAVNKSELCLKSEIFFSCAKTCEYC
eukprot:jgi/Psemu1/291231/fgenesh1_pg.652_\